MFTLLRQEGYKAIKGKSIWISLILLLAYQLLITIAIKQFKIISPTEFLTTNGQSRSIVEIIMVVIASTIITNEFVNKTIKNLLARQYSRLQVYLSKIITLVWIYAIIVIVNNCFTFVLKLIFFNNTSVSDHMIKEMVNAGVGQAIYVFLIASFVLLISNIAKSSGASIGAGVASIFATQIISQLLAILINKYEWVKYNPFNFFMVENQYDTSAFKELTHLSLNMITAGAFVYGIIFIGLGYLIFNKRNI